MPATLPLDIRTGDPSPPCSTKHQTWVLSPPLLQTSHLGTYPSARDIKIVHLGTYPPSLPQHLGVATETEGRTVS